MSATLELSRETMLPNSVETERLLLGALIVDWTVRNKVTAELTRDLFHDEFHGWLFMALRSARRCSTDSELWRHLQEEASYAPWIGCNLAPWIARLLVNANAASICGKRHSINGYRRDLERIAKRRRRIIELEAELLKLIGSDDA